MKKQKRFELFELARSLEIKNYNRMRYIELLREIKSRLKISTKEAIQKRR